MFRRLICCAQQQTQSPTADVSSSDSSQDAKPTKTNGLVFWLKRIFGLAPKKDRPPSKKKTARRWHSRNKVFPSSIKEEPTPTPVQASDAESIKPTFCARHSRVTPAEAKGPELDFKLRRKAFNQWLSNNAPQKTVSFHLARFGLPNIGNSCYINATLQSLFTIKPFMENVSSQQMIWRGSGQADLLRYLHAIKESRTAAVTDQKINSLLTFKAIVASNSPEFQGSEQKDAHEFLTELMGQIQHLAPTLQDFASSLHNTYRCPVRTLMEFSMNQIRTCLRCEGESCRTEIFNSLSLNLCPGASVDYLLKDYFKQTELEFRCSCGGQNSTLKPSLSTLPNVLILHLKRFRYTPNYQLQKINDDVFLNRDLVVSSEMGGACFSLVGIISHLGTNAQHGHYVFDGRDPTSCPNDQSDRWLLYNDSQVSKRTGGKVCGMREKTAYILFYQRLH